MVFLCVVFLDCLCYCVRGNYVILLLLCFVKIVRCLFWISAGNYVIFIKINFMEVVWSLLCSWILCDLFLDCVHWSYATFISDVLNWNCVTFIVLCLWKLFDFSFACHHGGCAPLEQVLDSRPSFSFIGSKERVCSMTITVHYIHV